MQDSWVLLLHWQSLYSTGVHVSEVMDCATGCEAADWKEINQRKDKFFGILSNAPSAAA